MKPAKTLLCLLVLIFSVPLISGCGKRGPLTVPKPHAPKVLKSLTLRQIGNRVYIKFTIPSVLQNAEKFLEEDIKQVIIYGTNETYKDGQFKKKSEILLKKPISYFKQIAPFKYETSISFKNSFLDNRILSISIRYKVNRRKSKPGNIARLETSAPPSPVRLPEIQRRKKLIILRWKPPVVSVSGDPLDKLKYKIYKFVTPPVKEDEEKVKSPPKPEFPESFQKIGETNINYYEDITGEDGTYYYVVTSIKGKTESYPSVFRSLEISDEFPPEKPLRILSMSAAGHIYITWKKSPEKDFSHYNIYRKAEGSDELVLISEELKTTFYKDRNVEKGKKYSYAVTAVDKKGNESEYSVVVTEEYI